MWIFLNDAFLSALQLREQPDRLMVRARRREDLVRVFGEGTDIVELAAADYPSRVTVPKADLAARLARRVEAIDYPDFKDSVPEPGRHDAYMAHGRLVRDAALPVAVAAARGSQRTAVRFFWPAKPAVWQTSAGTRAVLASRSCHSCRSPGGPDARSRTS